MASVKAKSEDNYKAAQLLINNSLYAPSIHCLYYSCFLLSKRGLVEIGKSYTVQDTESKGKDSHAYIMQLLDSDLVKKSYLAHLDYNEYFGKLKKMRRKADYSNLSITEKEANTSLIWAEKVNKLLTVQYKL